MQDYYQQFTHGFHSYIYLGELKICWPLYDPDGVLAELKAQVAVFPPVLKRELIQEWYWGVDFARPVLRKFAVRGDVYNTAGAVARVAASLTQVLFALNEEYFITDKGALEQIETFAIRPERYGERLRAILAHAGATREELMQTVEQFERLCDEVGALCREWYMPRFPIPGLHAESRPGDAAEHTEHTEPRNEPAHLDRRRAAASSTSTNG